MNTKALVKLNLAGPFRSHCNGENQILIKATTVQEALHLLTQKYPSVYSSLFDSQKNLLRHVNVFLNEEDIRLIDQERLILQKNDQLDIIPAISGG